MVKTSTRSVVDEYVSMEPCDFAGSVVPKLWAAERYAADVSAAVVRGSLTPLEGARLISTVAATLFGYDEFVLDELLSATAPYDVEG
jgi:hypothetical protein